LPCAVDLQALPGMPCCTECWRAILSISVLGRLAKGQSDPYLAPVAWSSQRFCRSGSEQWPIFSRPQPWSLGCYATTAPGAALIRVWGLRPKFNTSALRMEIIMEYSVVLIVQLYIWIVTTLHPGAAGTVSDSVRVTRVSIDWEILAIYITPRSIYLYQPITRRATRRTATRTRSGSVRTNRRGRGRI
jgi:hypothetical protein